MPKYGRPDMLVQEEEVGNEMGNAQGMIGVAVEEYKRSVELEAEKRAEAEAERVASNSVALQEMWNSVEEPGGGDGFADALRRGAAASRSLSVGSAPSYSSPFQRREHKRKREVVSSVLEKILANIGVLGELKEGDKLVTNARGYFVIQKPSWYTKGMRTLDTSADRWKTYESIENLISTADYIVEEGGVSDMRVREVLVNAIHGLRNLQQTYYDDVTFRNQMQVLLQRIELRYELDEQQML